MLQAMQRVSVATDPNNPQARRKMDKIHDDIWNIRRSYGSFMKFWGDPLMFRILFDIYICFSSSSSLSFRTWDSTWTPGGEADQWPKQFASSGQTTWASGEGQS